MNKNVINSNCENGKKSLRIGKLLFIFGFVLMFSVKSFADDGDETGDGDPDAPFDGGISILVASGIAYGAKRWYDDSKKPKKQNDLNSDI